jgi:microcystin-dependent protein
MSQPFLGEIRMVGFTFAPPNWAFCNGQILPIATNTALFSLLGTTYGGNGTTTFALPNLQSRVPIHAGQGPGLSAYVQGQTGGAETVVLNTTQIPAHNHTLAASSAAATALTPAGNYLGVVSRAATPPYATTGGATMNAAAIGNTGGGQAHSNLQPYLCVNFVIAVAGIFPSRN